MRLGVISDSHGRVANVQAAVRMLESLEVDEVLHCGDIDSPEIPRLLTGWRAHFVFGNCDHDEAELRQAIEAAGLLCHGRFADLQLGGRKIALLHSHDARRFREVCSNGEYDLVCYGHTHEAEQHRAGKTLILNPGALHRATPHTLAIVDLDTLEASIVPV
ncbi:MAG: YfcE family phosphodiesterase [Pirellulaceae bacterium]|nr:YfcE family phosphodiesterase [Pirellulaceae bacterium]